LHTQLAYHCAVKIHIIEYLDEENADKHDEDLWVVDRSGLGLDLIKREHLSFTHSGKSGGRNQNYRQFLAVLCKANQQSLLAAGKARAHISHCQWRIALNT
jgi:hypothetical protein